jgi:hypothetical protein
MEESNHSEPDEFKISAEELEKLRQIASQKESIDPLDYQDDFNELVNRIDSQNYFNEPTTLLVMLGDMNQYIIDRDILIVQTFLDMEASNRSNREKTSKLEEEVKILKKRIIISGTFIFMIAISLPVIIFNQYSLRNKIK